MWARGAFGDLLRNVTISILVVWISDVCSDVLRYQTIWFLQLYITNTRQRSVCQWLTTGSDIVGHTTATYISSQVLMKVLCHPGHGGSERCIVGNWACFTHGFAFNWKYWGVWQKIQKAGWVQEPPSAWDATQRAYTSVPEWKEMWPQGSKPAGSALLGHFQNEFLCSYISLQFKG